MRSVPPIYSATWSLALAAALSPAVSAAPGTPFALRVTEDAGIARQGEYTGCGVPFARGALRPGTPVALADARGQLLPVQTAPLAHWDDGSIRWLHVVFPLSLAPRADVELQARPGVASPEVARPVRARETPEGVEVDTGALRFRVDRKSGLLTGIAVGGAPAGLGPLPLTVVRTGEGEHRAGTLAPDDLALETSGPLMARVRVSGWLAGPGGVKHQRVTMRIEAYAGSADVRILHTWAILEGPAAPKVEEVALEFPAPLAGVADASGGFAVAAPGARLTVATRHYRETGPKAVRPGDGGARLLLYAGPPMVIGRTRARSHDLRLSFAPAGQAGPPPAEAARAWERRLLPVVAPAYLCDTEALVVLSPVDREFFPALEEGIDAAFTRFKEKTDADPAAHGFLDFGDWPLAEKAYSHKGTAYVDQEYDTTHALLQLFARSGDRRMFDMGEAAARHFMDVDINQVTGENRFHGYGDACETHRECTTGLEWGHVMADGLVDFYYLTGDPRTLEMVRRVGDVCARIGEGEGLEPRRNVFKGAERNLGWPLAALMRVYEATRDEKYRKTADKVVAYLQHFARDPEAELAHGTWWRTWMLDGCKPFMVGILHEGLDQHHELTRDPGTRAAILKSLDWMAEHMWNPERECFLYEFNAMNPGHRNQYPVSLNLLVAHAYGYGYRLTRDERYRDIGLRALRAAVEGLPAAGETGKDFGITLRSCLQVTGHFYRDRASFRFPPKPSPVAFEVVPVRIFPGVDAAKAVVLKPSAAKLAEGIDLRDRPGTVEGKTLTSWEEPGTWVEWQPELPAGRWAVLLRYASGHPDSVRALAVDGRETARIPLPETGGWGTAPSQWRQEVACARPGSALILDLPAGKHTLRLTRVSGGLALDTLVLVPVPGPAAVHLAPAPAPDEPLALVAHYRFDGSLAPAQETIDHRPQTTDPAGSRTSTSTSTAPAPPHDPTTSQPHHPTTPPPSVVLTDSYRGAGDDGFESGLNFGDNEEQARAICQFILPRETLDVEAFQVEVASDPKLVEFSVLLLSVDALDVKAPERGRVLHSWQVKGVRPGGLLLRGSEAEPAAARIRLEAGKQYAILFLHDPDGDRRPDVVKDGTSTNTSIRADRNSQGNPKALWYQGDRWVEFPYVVWINAVTDLERLGRPEARFAAGKEGQAVVLDSRFHGTFPVPPDFLSRAGSIELWIQPTWELSNATPGQRAIFHVMGERPFANALTLCTIYGDLRVRLYDARGHLCGTLEAPATSWKKGEWHHVALRWGPGRMALLLDGKEAASTTSLALPPGPVKVLHLGWRPGNWYLDAAIDELRLAAAGPGK